MEASKNNVTFLSCQNYPSWNFTPLPTTFNSCSINKFRPSHYSNDFIVPLISQFEKLRITPKNFCVDKKNVHENFCVQQTARKFFLDSQQTSLISHPFQKIHSLRNNEIMQQPIGEYTFEKNYSLPKKSSPDSNLIVSTFLSACNEQNENEKFNSYFARMKNLMKQTNGRLSEKDLINRLILGLEEDCCQDVVRKYSKENFINWQKIIDEINQIELECEKNDKSNVCDSNIILSHNPELCNYSQEKEHKSENNSYSPCFETQNTNAYVLTNSKRENLRKKLQDKISLIYVDFLKHETQNQPKLIKTVCDSEWNIEHMEMNECSSYAQERRQILNSYPVHFKYQIISILMLFFIILINRNIAIKF